MKSPSVTAFLIVIIVLGGGWFALRYKRRTQDLISARASVAELNGNRATVDRRPEQPHLNSSAQPEGDQGPALGIAAAAVSKEIEDMRGRLSSQRFDAQPRGATTFQDAGRAEPSLAVETLFWSLNGGDVSALESSIILHPTLKKEADDLFKSLSEPARQRYHSSEHLVATLLATGATIASMQVSDVSIEKTPNIATVKMKLQYADGGLAETTLTMIRNGSEWLWAVPAETFRKFGGVLNGTLDISATPLK